MQPHPLSRRTFLAVVGAMPFVLKAPPLTAQTRNVPIGIELYSVRDELAKDLPGTVRAVAKMGYEVVEFYSPYFSWTPQQATDVRKLLDDLGIKCHSTHNGAQAFSGDGLQKAIDLNKTLGSKYIVMASPPQGAMSNIDGAKNVGNILNAANEKLKPLGMAPGYHNHQQEWRAFDGQRWMDVLAANTANDVVLQFDVGTCVEAGADPIAWIRANPGRIKSSHLKDWGAGAGRGYAVVFGEGDSPWAKIFEALESGGGVEYYLIEQEAGPATEQFQRAERCMANYKKMRG